MTDWDVIVIGAGPAGSMAARESATLGLRTLLVERKEWPRPKVCGACINRRAISWLEAAELGHILAEIGAVALTRFHVQCGGQGVAVALPKGAAASRSAFDAALANEAVRAGATFVSKTMARLAQDDLRRKCREVLLADAGGTNRRVSAKAVVIADGLGHSSIDPAEFPVRVARASRIGASAVVCEAPPHYREGVIYMAVGREGYVGAVRIEDGSLNLAAALDAAAIRKHGSINRLATSILEQAGLPDIPALVHADWRGTVPLTRWTTRIAGRRVLLLGDAAGYVEPFTGEGIAWALASGIAVAPLIERGADLWTDDLESAWTKTYRQLVFDRQGWCRTFAYVLRRPMLVRTAIAAANAIPVLARPVVRSLNQPARTKEVCPR